MTAAAHLPSSESTDRLTLFDGQEMTFQSWVEYVKKRGGKVRPLEGRWDPGMSLAQALEIIDEYSRSIERSIQERLKEERKKRE